MKKIKVKNQERVDVISSFIVGCIGAALLYYVANNIVLFSTISRLP